MSPPQVFVIGGTGAQGIPIVESLVQDNAFAVRILTRNQTSRRAKELALLSPGISFLEGSFAKESTLRSGFTGATIAFVNVDGFNTGEKAKSSGESGALWKRWVRVNGLVPRRLLSHGIRRRSGL